MEDTPFEVPANLGSAAEGTIDLPAVVISLLVMMVLILGIKLSSVINQIVVAVKLCVIAAVILFGIAHVDTANYSPFVPDSEPTPEGSGGFMDQTLISWLLGIDPAVYGIAGVIAGASIVFFAFIGFDIVATTAEEARDPQRDIPRGILGSLAIVTALYIVVSLIITGMQSYTDIDPGDPAPLATAFDSVDMDWMGRLIAIGACIGLIVVVMILMLGQTRVGFAMARDGLLPIGLAKVHPKFGTPYVFTAITGIAVAIIGGLVDLETLVHLVSIGTLFAFVLVSVGVAVLRRQRPDLPRSFRTPAVYVVAACSVLLCFYLMLNLTGGTWVRFLVWMAIGLVVYFGYSASHSRLGRGEYDKHTTPDTI
jgi:APA family basic amino acid/polyamine antiporter